MADRVVHRVANWEDLLKMSDPLAIKSSNVTAESPIRIRSSSWLRRRTSSSSLAEQWLKAWRWSADAMVGNCIGSLS